MIIKVFVASSSTEGKTPSRKVFWRKLRRFLIALLAYVLLISATAIFAANVVVWLRPKQYADPMSLSLAAALVAIAGVLLSVQWKFNEKQEERSKFYLERSLAGWDKAFEILRDSLPDECPDRRTKWIAAARVLERARLVSSVVSEVAHQNVLEIELTYQRQKFHQFFELPAAFYYGINTKALLLLTEGERLGEAARRATQGTGTTISTLRQIPESAIYTLWRALQYPADYLDVIDRTAKFDDGPLIFLDKGLQEYIGHTREWHSASGKLWPRKPVPGDSGHESE